MADHKMDPRTDALRSDFISHIRIVMMVVISVITILVFTAYYVEPMHGELTRLGGYSERDFGGTIPQKMIPPGQSLPNRFDRYYDMLVVGDSFSRSGLWQSFVQAETGFSFTTLDVFTTSLDELLSSPRFQQDPPKVMVVELGERGLVPKFANLGGACPEGARIQNPGLIPEVAAGGTIAARTVKFEERARPRTPEWSDINLKFSFMVIQQSLTRWLLGHDFSQVSKLPLSRTELFSNRRSGEILLFAEDFSKTRWAPEQVSAAGCMLRKLQDRVQANGKTRFVFLLIPDKTNAYSEFIQDDRVRRMPKTYPVLAEIGVNVPRLDVALTAAISSGEVDVYLPNDTHFGTRGYELTARTLLHALR